MGGLAFLGGFLAVIVGIGAVVYYLRNKIRSFSRKAFGKPDLLDALAEIDTAAEDSPRSLNGCDTLLLPQILRDFPDFDVSLAKTYARNYLTEKLGRNDAFTVYNIVIARYLPSAAQKTIVLQAAVSYRANVEKVQKRFDLHYSYILSGSSESVAANCPNCGGTMGYGLTVCPYCGSRVANILGNTWKFTEMKET